MTEEVQIAIIASSSAIGGGLVTGTFGFFADFFRSRREEHHRIAAERRQAYIELSHTLNSCFPHPDSTTTLTDLNRVAARVQVIDSNQVAEAAQKARHAVGLFLLAQDFKPRTNPLKILQQKAEIATKAKDSIAEFQRIARTEADST